MYRRALEDRWSAAARQFPVALLTGPRQVGKTTLLRALASGTRTYVTLDDPDMRNLAVQEPRLFLERLPSPLLIDEIQYAPGLLPLIKIAVDETRRPGMFWLTGSQQFPLMKGVTESLGGRVAIVQMLGFSRRETEARRLDLEPFLPIRSRIEERSETAGPTTMDQVFQRIWMGSVPTAKSWLSILEASMQVYLLPPWHADLTQRLVKRPKLYFLDTGLSAYLTRWTSPESLAHGAMAGSIFETFMVAETLKAFWHRARVPVAHYFRDRDGREVDLLLEEEGTLYPIEFKLSASPRREWTRAWRGSRILGPRAGPGAVVCLAPTPLPLTDTDWAVPAGLI